MSSIPGQELRSCMSFGTAKKRPDMARRAEGGHPTILGRWGSQEIPGKALEEVEAFSLTVNADTRRRWVTHPMKARESVLYPTAMTEGLKVGAEAVFTPKNLEVLDAAEQCNTALEHVEGEGKPSIEEPSFC